MKRNKPIPIEVVEYLPEPEPEPVEKSGLLDDDYEDPWDYYPCKWAIFKATSNQGMWFCVTHISLKKTTEKPTEPCQHFKVKK